MLNFNQKLFKLTRFSDNFSGCRNLSFATWLEYWMNNSL